MPMGSMESLQRPLQLGSFFLLPVYDNLCVGNPVIKASVLFEVVVTDPLLELFVVYRDSPGS